MVDFKAAFLAGKKSIIAIVGLYAVYFILSVFVDRYAFRSLVWLEFIVLFPLLLGYAGYLAAKGKNGSVGKGVLAGTVAGSVAGVLVGILAMLDVVTTPLIYTKADAFIGWQPGVVYAIVCALIMVFIGAICGAVGGFIGHKKKG